MVFPVRLSAIKTSLVGINFQTSIHRHGRARRAFNSPPRVFTCIFILLFTVNCHVSYLLRLDLTFFFYLIFPVVEFARQNILQEALSFVPP